MKNSYIFFIILYLQVGGYSQLSFNSYAITDFVKESGKINTGFIDSKNNIWIGTCSAEVIHFDGNTWNYYDKDFLKLGRSYDCVNAFYEDSQSRIWMVADGGIILYNDGAWKYYRGEAPQYYTHDIKEWNGKMLFSSFRGINILENDKWRFVDLPTSISAASLEVDKNNNLWACFSNGDPCFIFNSDEWQEVNSENSGICPGYRNILHLGSDSTLYLSGPSGYFCSFDGNSFTNLGAKIQNIKFSYLSSILTLREGPDVFVAGNTNNYSNSLLAQVGAGETIYYDYRSGLVKGNIVSLALDVNNKIMAFSEDSISYEGILETTSTNNFLLKNNFILNNIVNHELRIDNSKSQNFTVRVVSIDGRLEMVKQNVSSSIFVDHLEPGLYFVQILENNMIVSTEKIIKID